MMLIAMLVAQSCLLEFKKKMNAVFSKFSFPSRTTKLTCKIAVIDLSRTDHVDDDTFNSNLN